MIDTQLEELAKKIKLVIFDVDGVLSDGGIYFSNDGSEFKKFNVKDGLGLSWMAKTDIHVAIITGRKSNLVKTRMNSLGIKHVYQGKLDKIGAYEELLDKLKISEKESAYVGDDVIDLPIMKRCGLPIAVADAHNSVKSVAKWVTEAKGGHGAGREVCDLILGVQNKSIDIEKLSQ